MTAILRLQLDDKDPVRVNSAINQLAEYSDRNQRAKLTANATFYVSTSGSDSNSGSQSSPFRTIQFAYDLIANTFDLSGLSFTIQCASGTYTTGLGVLQPWFGGNVVLDLGGGTINASGDCVVVKCTIPSALTVQNGTLISPGAHCIEHAGSGIVIVGPGMTFGSVLGAHILSSGSGSKIQIANGYTITGGGQFHYLAFKAGNSIEGQGITITLTGTPAFSFTFALASRVGAMDLPSLTFSGSATGTRYSVDTNGVIYTGGGGANYFPGTIPGGTDGFGVYL